MSNLKNKIIKGTNQSNEIQSNNSGLISSVIQPSHIQLERKSQFNAQSNQNSVGFRPSPIFNNGFQTMSHQHGGRPRSLS